MEPRHRDKIQDNLAFLVKDLDYDRLRPHLISQKLFPSHHLTRLEDRASNRKLELFLQVQRRGPTAFRRLVASLHFSGHNQSVQVLTENEESLLLTTDSCLSNSCSSSSLNSTSSLNSSNGSWSSSSSFLPLHHPSIDLTDSPLQPDQIVIDPAMVYRPEDGMTYRMTSSPRGMALIIDNEEFENLPPRRGSHIDSDCLARLYQQLGFWVVIKKNLRKISLEFELFSFATDNIHHQLDMSIVTVLSHGENGAIICTNGEKIQIEDILTKFNNKEAPPLKGKPKFFIFQSCRGLNIDPGVESDGPEDVRMGGETEDQDQEFVSLSQFISPSSAGRVVPELESLARDPSYEDMFVSFATIPTYVAYRNNMKGSWFIQCLCKVFMRYSCEEDLVALLLRVSKELKVFCTTRGEKQINETLLRGVTRKLFFNPGLIRPPARHVTIASHATLPGHVTLPRHVTVPGHQMVEVGTTSCLLKTRHREAALERTGLTNLRVGGEVGGQNLRLDDVWSGLLVEDRNTGLPQG